MLSREIDYVSLSLSDKLLKIAELKITTASRKIMRVAQLEFPEGTQEASSKAIQSLLASVSAKKSQVIFVVPSHVLTTKNIEIPSVNPEEINSIVNLQAGRHTPYSREEILIGYINIGVYQSNYTKILLVIANRSVVKKKLELLKQAGIDIDRVLIAPEGIARFYSRILNLRDDKKPSGIIDIKHNETDFMIALRGTCIYFRNIPVGLSHLNSEGDAAHSRLVQEISKSLESYQNEDIDQVPQQFILTQPETQFTGLLTLLKEKLKSEVKCVPYLDHVKLGPNLLTQAAGEFKDDSYMDVIAPAIESQVVEVDLLPEEIKMKKSFEKHGRDVLKAGVLSFLLLVFIGGLSLNRYYFHRTYLNRLEAQYKPTHQEVEKLRQESLKARIVKDFLSSRQATLDTIVEMYKIIPSEIYLSNINVDESGAVSVQGISESMSRVFSLVSSLEDSNLFYGVKTKSTSTKKDRGKDVATFEITLHLEGTESDEDLEQEEGQVGEEKKAAK